MKRALDVLLRLNGIDPVTLEPTGPASSAGSPFPGSNSVADNNTQSAEEPNQRSPINLAEMTPQSVEGFQFEDRS